MTTATALATLIEQRTALVSQVQQLQAAIAAIDEQLLAAVATKVEPEQKPTTVEPEPEQAPVKVKSIAQEKAEANARVALANKGKSAKEKAEALDVPVATVKKVEKAKAQATKSASTDMKAAELRKLAKELKVDVSKVDFRSKTQRLALQAELQTKQADSKVWQGLSASRQAELNKLARTTAN